MEAARVLKTYLKRKVAVNQGYSLRALARDLKSSSSFVSEVLSAKKKMPISWQRRLIKILDLDDLAIGELKRALYNDHVRGTDIEQLLEPTLHFNSRVSLDYKPVDKKKYQVLTKWYYLALLDLLTCEGLDKSEQALAKKLGISLAAIREALKVLSEQKMIGQDDDGAFYKTDQKVRFPTTKTDPLVRNFHIQMIEKAKMELYKKVSVEDFQQRLIFGSTVATDVSHIEDVKAKLLQCVTDSSAQLSEGQATELYQINVQFFPLTTK